MQIPLSLYREEQISGFDFEIFVVYASSWNRQSQAMHETFPPLSLWYIGVIRRRWLERGLVEGEHCCEPEEDDGEWRRNVRAGV